MSVPIAAVTTTLVALVFAIGASPAAVQQASVPAPEAVQVLAHRPAEQSAPAPLPLPLPEKTAPAPLPTPQPAPEQSAPAPATVDCRKAKCIALTFDDGPIRQTASVLNALKARGARATFFVLGSQARAHPALLRRMVAEGHAIGNHSWSHPQFFHARSATVRKQIRKTNAAIRSATGTTPVIMRPPFGQQDARIRKSIREFGEAVVLWSVDTEDWKYRSTKRVTRYVVKHAKRDAIVLLHDIRPTTRAAAPAIVAKLQAKGYTLVTVPELLRGRLKAGKVYTNG